VYSGRLTQPVVEQFTPFTRRAFHQFVNDRIGERLKSALDEEMRVEVTEKPIQETEQEDVVEDDRESESKIITTEEEIHAFYVVKAILHDTIDIKRVTVRDRISYCGILLDDNNRKPICRLRFNSPQKYLGVFDSGRSEERIPIEGVDDIYCHADRLKQTVVAYDSPASPTPDEEQS